jgi:serine/threonine protein kinase
MLLAGGDIRSSKFTNVVPRGRSRRIAAMALTRGTRFGPYQVSEQIGAGGMGEVYRATDISLGWEVAIKVLPEAFAHDEGRLARFEREARTLASLNHPKRAGKMTFARALHGSGVRHSVRRSVISVRPSVQARG